MTKQTSNETTPKPAQLIPVGFGAATACAIAMTLFGNETLQWAGLGVGIIGGAVIWPLEMIGVTTMDRSAKWRRWATTTLPMWLLLGMNVLLFRF